MAKNKKNIQISKHNTKARAKAVPKIGIHFVLVILALVPIAFASIFQGGYFAWETYATLLLSLPAIFLFTYLKFVRGEPLRASGSELSLFLFLAVCALSILFTVYFQATLTELYKVIDYLVIFYIVLDSVKKEELYNFAIGAILAMSTILSLGGIIAFIGYKLNLQSSFFKFLTAYGLMQGAAVSSTLQYSNTFGAFLILPFFVSLGAFLKTNKPYKKILLILLSLLFLATFVLTQSRGALLTFAVALVLFVLLTKGRERKISILYFIGIVVIFALLIVVKKDVFLPIFASLINKVKDTFLFLKGQGGQSLRGRITMIKDSLNILKSHPIFGIGNGTYQYIYAKYRSVYFFSKFPHSIFFQVLDELGLVGGVAFVYMIGSLFVRGFKVVKTHYSTLLLGLYAGIVGLCLHALIDFDWSLMFMPMLFFFVFGIVLSQGEQSIFALKCPIREFFRKKGVVKELKIKKNEFSYINRLLFLGFLSVAVFLMLLFPLLSANTDRVASAKVGTVSGTEIISLYQTAIDLNPLDASPHYDLAHYYTGAVMPNVQNPSDYVQDALDQYSAAIRRCPDFFLYHYELGKLYLQLSDAKSIDEFAKGVALNPLDPGGHASLAFAYLNIKKNTDMAKIQLDEALKLAQEAIAQGYATQDILADTYTGFGALYEQLNESDKALENYNLAIKVNYQNAYAYYRSGAIYESKNSLPQMVQSLFYAVHYNSVLSAAKTEFEKYAPIITLANPQNGTSFKPNDTLNIQWIPSNFNNTESYAIYLIPPKGDQIILSSNIDPETLSYVWKVPDKFPDGKYTLRIYAYSPKFMQGKLDNWISYTDATISIQK